LVNPSEALRVRLVLSADNRSWIIEKMAERLKQYSAGFGISADIAEAPNPTADVNHWMSYAFANVRHSTPTSMLITHLDDPYKVRLVKDELNSGVDLGICLSSHTQDKLIQSGVDRDSVTFVIPGHDFVAVPGRITIGLTTRTYPDGRKREHMLINLARSMPLSAFKFLIFGKGWDKVIPELEASGAEVDYRPGTDDFVADYAEIAASIPKMDYYLYLGRDEGSLGTLDALAAGVKTIVTPQGFHVDLPNGITHPVWEQEDLYAVFSKLHDGRQQRIEGVADFSWENYVRQHAIAWKALKDGCRGEINARLASTRKADGPAIQPRNASKLHMLLLATHPKRIRSALSHVPLLKPLRNWIKAKQRG
jgi:hypothetical protein